MFMSFTSRTPSSSQCRMRKIALSLAGDVKKLKKKKKERKKCELCLVCFPNKHTFSRVKGFAKTLSPLYSELII